MKQRAGEVASGDAEPGCLAEAKQFVVVADVDDAERLVIADLQRKFAGRTFEVLYVEAAAGRGIEQRGKYFVVDLRRAEMLARQVLESPGEEVFAIRGNQSLAQHALDRLDGLGPVSQEALEEQQDLDDIGHRSASFGSHSVDAAADEHPQRLLDLKRLEVCRLLGEEALLLEERQETGDEIGLLVFSVKLLFEIENLVVLAEPVTVEVPIRVVDQHALGVLVAQALVATLGLAALHRLTKRG